MMVGVEKCVVDVMVAQTTLERMLLGSYLDSFSASSLSVSLRLINSSVSPDVSLYIDLGFSCPAKVLDSSALDGVATHDDFFKGRATFFSKIHAKIGCDVGGIELDASGRLRLCMDDSAIELAPDDDDMEAEDSIWQVLIEVGAGSNASAGGSVCCVPAHDGVLFVSDARRQ
jgi:hypothetical protein